MRCDGADWKSRLAISRGGTAVLLKSFCCLILSLWCVFPRRPTGCLRFDGNLKQVGWKIQTIAGVLLHTHREREWKKAVDLLHFSLITSVHLLRFSTALSIGSVSYRCCGCGEAYRAYASSLPCPKWGISFAIQAAHESFLGMSEYGFVCRIVLWWNETMEWNHNLDLVLSWKVLGMDDCGLWFDEWWAD